MTRQTQQPQAPSSDPDSPATLPEDPSWTVSNDEAALAAIVLRVREATRVDIGLYKGSTFERQLMRRLKELGLHRLGDYADLLQSDDQELHRLQESLLISVTGFFRDTPVFEHVAAVLRELVAQALDNRQGLRLWVAGCAGGEEALSLAMLIAQALGDRVDEIPVRVFATDIDAHAIRRARKGVYDTSALADVPPAWRQRYFVADDGGMRAGRLIREMCVFAQHDLLSEPPFVNLQFISCRNVLIYLKSAVQADILQRFSQALMPGGWLLLGQSESVGLRDADFEAPDVGVRLYRRASGGASAAPARLDTPVLMQPPPPVAWRGKAERGQSPNMESRFHDLLLQSHVPPSVLVDLQGRVLHVWGDISRYLRLDAGRADFTLTGLCVPGLRDELRTLLHLALSSTDGRAQGRHVTLDDGQEPSRLHITAALMRHSPEGETLAVTVTFSADGPLTNGSWPQAGDAADHLVAELVDSRSQLHQLVARLDEAELDRQILREELQVTSEELQSSNEELQASNEELTTLNEQLIEKSQTLERLNDTLQSVERSMEVGLVVVDARLRVQRFNALAVRIFGLLEHDVGRPLTSVPCNLPIDDLPGRIQQVLASSEAMVLRIDQDARHYVLQISVLRSMLGLAEGAILMFTDVAELRQAEFETAQLAAIVTSSEDAIIGKTLRGTVISWNPAAERMFGYSAAEVLNRAVPELFPAEQASAEVSLLARIASGEVVASFDTVRLTADGSRLDVSISMSPIRDPTGHIVGASKIVRDISSRKALEVAALAHKEHLEQQVVDRTRDLAEKERQLHTILDGIPGLVAYWDRQLRLRFANRAHRMTVSSHVEPLGRTMAEILGPHDYAVVQPHVAQALSGRACRFEIWPRPPAGKVEDRAFQVHYVPDIDAGVVQGFIVLVFDISDVKRAELAAETANLAKSAFLATMSHEIRTPLNAVLGLAQSARLKSREPDMLRSFELIIQSGQHLLGVINDVLDFSKIEAGKLELRLTAVDLGGLVHNVVSMVGNPARAKELKLTTRLDPALAPVYLGDSVRLSQILINLLSNAVKFTHQGEVCIDVKVTGAGVILTVKDTGIGMDAETMTRLFTPFEQGDARTTRRYGGSGLGLTICKRLIDLMQGSIHVTSEPAMGSAFEVWLPLRPADSAHAEPLRLSVPQPMLHGTARALEGVRVLVAEDQPLNQLVLEELLKSQGAVLQMVPNGALLVDLVKSLGTRAAQSFDLVLCDIEMPVMDGYEATRILRKLAPELPVVGLTAHAFEDARHRGTEVGMAGYVTKPYMLDDLVGEIRRQVAARVVAGE